MAKKKRLSRKFIRFLYNAVVVISLLIMVIRGLLLLFSGVADYGKREVIWNVVAYNENKSKLDDMSIDYSWSLEQAGSSYSVIIGDEYVDGEVAMDTYTYLTEIKAGYENDTYTDEPYIIPYLVNHPKGGIIVVCGGAYGHKTIDGDTGEGKVIAKELNKRGYCAFVMHYRSNPYEYPVPALDLQRSVRYVKANSSRYGIKKDKVGIIGFSAGGNLVGIYINQIMGRDFLPEDYEKDFVDEVDDSVMGAMMIYPALSFRDNVPMLFGLYDEEVIKDPVAREKLLDDSDLSMQFDSVDTPQFVAYGTEDSVVGWRETVKYINEAGKKGASVHVCVVEGWNHGFSPSCYMDEMAIWLDELGD